MIPRYLLGRDNFLLPLCAMTTHTDMQLFIQLNQLLWLHSDEFHTNCELHSILRGSSCVWTVKLVVHAWHLLETSVTRSWPYHAAIRLTQHRLIWKWVTVHAANTFNLSHLRSLRFLPHQCYSAKVCINVGKWSDQAYIHTYIHIHRCNAILLVWGSLRLAPISMISMNCVVVL